MEPDIVLLAMDNGLVVPETTCNQSLVGSPQRPPREAEVIYPGSENDSATVALRRRGLVSKKPHCVDIYK